MRLLTFVGSAGSTCSGAYVEVAAGRHLSAMDASDALCDENESFSSSFQLFLRLWREDENAAMNFLSSGELTHKFLRLCNCTISRIWDKCRCKSLHSNRTIWIATFLCDGIPSSFTNIHSSAVNYRAVHCILAFDLNGL